MSSRSLDKHDATRERVASWPRFRCNRWASEHGFDRLFRRNL